MGDNSTAGDSNAQETWIRDLQKLNAHLIAGTPLEVDAETRRLAEEAVKANRIHNERAKTIPGYVDEWAERLAKDFVQAGEAEYGERTAG